MAKRKTKSSKKEMKDITFLQSMKKLDVKDGDIVILKCPTKLSQDAYQNIKEKLEEKMIEIGFKIKVIILDEGMDIGVLTKSIE